MQNNMFALKFEQLEKTSTGDQTNEEYLGILKKSINREKLALDSIEDHKKEAVKMIEETLTSTVSKILKEEALKIKKVKTVRRSEVFYSCDK